MTIPKAVKEQAEAARKAHAQTLKDKGASPPQGVPATTPTESVNLPPGDTSQPPKQEAGAGATTDPLLDWETRYKQMRAAGDIRSKKLTEELDAANAKIKDLESKLSEVSTSNPSQDNSSTLMSEGEREFLGEEGAAVIDRMARQHADTVSALEAKIDKLTTPPGETTEQRSGTPAQDSFIEDLTRDAPDWKEVNGDQYFRAWLAQIDSATGAPRQNDLDLAQDARDGVSVARIVNRFLSENGTSGAQGAPSSYEPNTNRAGGDSRIYLEGEVPEGHTVEYSGSDIKEFYNRKTKTSNLFREGRATKDEMDRLAAEEAEIRKAYAEGRVSN